MAPSSWSRARTDAARGAACAGAGAPAGRNHSDGIYLAPFSSRGGPGFAADQKPDIVSPGVNVMAAKANTASAYVANSGAALATPVSAGSVALALDAWSGPAPGPAEMQAAIEATAEDFG